MIQYVNQSEIPESIFKAITDPYYQEGVEAFWSQVPEDIKNEVEDRHFSVTTLGKSPRQVQLNKRHSHKVMLDGLAGYWRLWGHIVHSILEQYEEADSYIEQRIFVVIETSAGPALLHGQADIIKYSKGLISDYKVTSPYSMLYGAKESYHAQLNLLGWIVSQPHWRYDPKDDHLHECDGVAIEELENIFMFRSLDKHRIKPDDPLDPYPKKEILVDPVPIWSEEKIAEYLDSKLESHIEALQLTDDELPFCTPEERWERPPVFKAFKLDPKTGQIQKRAKKVSEVRMEVEDYILENSHDSKGKKIDYRIESVSGEPVLCAGYCEICDFCNQRKEELKSNG